MVIAPQPVWEELPASMASIKATPEGQGVVVGTNEMATYMTTIIFIHQQNHE